jgi:hypothetical protein
VRADKGASLKQRLRREADAFEFNALIEGVSTLEGEELSADHPADSGTRYGSPIESPVLPLDLDGEPQAAAHPSAAAGDPHPAPMASVALSHPIEARPAGRYGTRAADREERLRSILDALGRRLLGEAALLRSAMIQGDAALAGERLARINQLCELLHSVDPLGDLGRQLGVAGAPPADRPWPSTAWSAAEFAESLFSALLPPTAPASFLGDMMFAAWGVQVERNGNV